MSTTSLPTFPSTINNIDDSLYTTPKKTKRATLRSTKLIQTPLPYDILCGKDRTSVSHFGSKHFRTVIESYRQRYQDAPTKQQKMELTKEIVNRLTASASSRFLRYNRQLNGWQEISQIAARDKVSHALRVANARQEKKQRNKVTNEQTSSTKQSLVVTEEAKSTIQQDDNGIQLTPTTTLTPMLGSPSIASSNLAALAMHTENSAMVWNCSPHDSNIDTDFLESLSFAEGGNEATSYKTKMTTETATPPKTRTKNKRGHVRKVSNDEPLAVWEHVNPLDMKSYNSVNTNCLRDLPFVEDRDESLGTDNSSTGTMIQATSIPALFPTNEKKCGRIRKACHNDALKMTSIFGGLVSPFTSSTQEEDGDEDKHPIWTLSSFDDNKRNHPLLNVTLNSSVADSNTRTDDCRHRPISSDTCTIDSKGLFPWEVNDQSTMDSILIAPALDEKAAEMDSSFHSIFFTDDDSDTKGPYGSTATIKDVSDPQQQPLSLECSAGPFVAAAVAANNKRKWPASEETFEDSFDTPQWSHDDLPATSTSLFPSPFPSCNASVTATGVPATIPVSGCNSALRLPNEDLALILREPLLECDLNDDEPFLPHWDNGEVDWTPNNLIL